ncbi:MAG: hypothetical protein WC637_07000, partial [Victivallales bacterium]
IKAWKEIPNNCSDFKETLFKLSFLLELDNSIKSKRYLDLSTKWNKPPHGGARKLVEDIHKIAKLRTAIVRCMSRFRSASPKNFVSKCVEILKKEGSNFSEEWIMASGRVAGCYSWGSPYSDLIGLLCKPWQSTSPQIIRAKAWAIGTFLRGEPNAANGINVENLKNTCIELIRFSRSQDKIDDGILQDVLFAIISTRLCMNYPEGVSIYGPRSNFVNEIAKELKNLEDYLHAKGCLKQLENISFKRLGIKEEDVFRSSNRIGQVSEIIQGFSTVTLTQREDI